MEAERKTKVGCCGFVVSQQEYFQLFNLIEIQNTFYQLPRLQTAEKWRATAPQGFEFTMKAWQLITHEPSSPTYRRLKSKIDPAKLDHYVSQRRLHYDNGITDNAISARSTRGLIAASRDKQGKHEYRESDNPH